MENNQKVSQFTSDEYVKIGEVARPFWEKDISVSRRSS
jgi:hypothetical protein